MPLTWASSVTLAFLMASIEFSKCLSKTLRRLGPTPGIVSQAAGQAHFAPTIAMAGNSEAMRFVTYALNKIKRFTAAGQQDRQRPIWQKDFFNALCQGRDRHPVCQAKFG